MNMSKRIFAVVLCVTMVISLLPVFSFAKNTYDASDYTKVQEIIPKLNSVLNGGAELFIDKVYENPDSTKDDLRVGGYINPDIQYTWGPSSRPHYGWTCFAYAQAVYYYLFGDVLYRCEGTDGYNYKYKSSEIALKDKKSLSFDILYNAGVGTGAYVEAPNHYYLILTYDRQTITTLGGNEDGWGKGEIKISNYTWNEFNKKGHRVPAYTIVQPTVTKNTICDHKYDENSFTCECGHIDLSSSDYVYYALQQLIENNVSSYYSPFGYGKKINTYSKGDAIKVSCSITNKEGKVSFMLADGSFIAGEYIKPLFIDLPGDVDGNESVTATDARIVLRASVGLEEIEKYSDKFRSADVDYDNKVTATDARYILRASVGLEDLYQLKSPFLL